LARTDKAFFSCSNCGSYLIVPREDGAEVLCPICGKEFVVSVDDKADEWSGIALNEAKGH
jgi:uncharacterized Zn finger protein (UPF0148 family)